MTELLIFCKTAPGRKRIQDYLRDKLFIDSDKTGISLAFVPSSTLDVKADKNGNLFFLKISNLSIHRASHALNMIKAKYSKSYVASQFKDFQ